MNWWQNLFIASSKHVTTRSTGQLNAVHIARHAEQPVIVAPVTGQLQRIVLDNDQLNHRNGFMMTPNGHDIMSPVAGIVTDAVPHAVTIRSERYGVVTVQVMSEKDQDVRLAAYRPGQQLHAGDLIGSVRQRDQAVRVYVLFEDHATPFVSYGAVYAGQNIWRPQEESHAKE